MDDLSPTDLKTILHSKRANIYYLEHCRVLVNGGRVEYLTQEGNRSKYWNIPIANTTCLLLGTGTSVTQSAARELAKAGVTFGFCGGGGTPLFSGTEALWVTSQSEYRPTEYLQAWARLWFDDAQRLNIAKRFQRIRLHQITLHWQRAASAGHWKIHTDQLDASVAACEAAIKVATDTTSLLSAEAALSKRLYAQAARATSVQDFRRAKRGSGVDPANRFLDHGNYLAYGLAATATWVLGIPHALAVLHGKTRRGALVFDVADLVKDAVVLPQAFISAERGDDERDFRAACVQRLRETDALDTMIDAIKAATGDHTPVTSV